MSDSLNTRLERLELRLREHHQSFADRFPGHPTTIVRRMFAELAAAGPMPPNPKMDAFVDALAVAVQNRQPWPPGPKDDPR